MMPVIPIEQIIGMAAVIAPIVYGLLLGLKQAGLPKDKTSARVALLVGPLFAIAWTLTHTAPSRAVLMEAFLVGLVGSLAAMGAYKLSQWSPPESPPAP